MRRLAPAEGWLTAGVLAVSVYVAVSAVESAGWGGGVRLAPPLALCGVAVGMLAAKSRLRSVWALPICFLIGLEAVLLGQGLMSPGVGWGEQLGGLYGRLGRWLSAASAQGAQHDTLVLAILLCYFSYLLGLASSWLVFRLQNGWWPLILSGAAGLVHLSYATTDSVPPYLASLLLGLLVVSSLELHLRRAAWGALRLPVQSSSTLWTLLSAAGLAGLALSVALLLPSGATNADLSARYQALTEPWRDLQRQVDQLVGGPRGQAQPGEALAFSRSLAPRHDFDLGSEPVLRVVARQPLYLRTMTYSRYTGRSIELDEATRLDYQVGQELPLDPEVIAQGSVIEQRITILARSSAALFAVEAPAGFSIPVRTEAREVPWDLAGLQPLVTLQRGQSYTVTSRVAATSSRERSPGGNMPPWLERYVELPPSLPARVTELANRVTEGAADPLSQALAIEAHLRTLQYTTHASVPPDGRDWVDYLLFDSRSGYCDYLATAMAVMLRTQGVPARVASGFAPGVYDEREAAWLVREREAHSWVEAYVPSYGWQTFEPSALRATPPRLETNPSSAQRQNAESGGGREPSEADDLPGSGQAPAGSGEGWPLQATSVGVGLAGVAALLILLGGILATLALFWELGLGAESSPRRRYAHLRRWLAWGHFPVRDSATPFELAEQVSERFPSLREPTTRLTRLHVEVTYGPSAIEHSSEQAEAAWRALRGPLAVEMLRHRLRGKDRHSPREARPG